MSRPHTSSATPLAYPAHGLSDSPAALPCCRPTTPSAGQVNSSHASGLSPFPQFLSGWRCEVLKHRKRVLSPVATLVFLAAAAGALLVAAYLVAVASHRPFLGAPGTGAGGRMFAMPVGSCRHANSAEQEECGFYSPHLITQLRSRCHDAQSQPRRMQSPGASLDEN